MECWVEVHGGARTGSVHPLTGEPVLVGRNEEAQLRLDPGADLTVSGRHALLAPAAGGVWAVRDLGSTNGTWVNDVPLEGERILEDGDHIRLGAGGPLLVFHAGKRRPATVRVPSAPRRGGQGRRLQWAVGVAVVAVLSTVTYLAGRLSTRRDWERERSTLEARMDSVLSVARARTAELRARNDSLARHRDADVQSLEVRVSGLLEALQRSEGEVRSLRTSLEGAKEDGLDDAEVTRLRQRLQTVSVELERQQLAASLDFPLIERVARAAVAQIYVDTPEGVATGTAFGVSPSGVLMTNRHVVQGPDGTSRPGRIGVQFADSRQVWPAHIIAVAPDADLALVQVERLEGTIPTLPGFDSRTDTLASGSPVAMIGFPLGGRPPEGAAGVVRPLITAGVIRGTRAGMLELQGYGERGASGSPVLDRDGRVVGVLIGSTRTDGERTLLAVPAAAAVRLMDQHRGG